MSLLREVVAIERPQRLHGGIEGAASDLPIVLTFAQDTDEVFGRRQQDSAAVQRDESGAVMIEAEESFQSPDLGHRSLHEALRGVPVRVMDLEGSERPHSVPPPGHEAGLGPSGATERHEAQTRHRRSDPDGASAGN